MLVCGAVLFLLVQSFAFADDKPKGPKVTDKVSLVYRRVLVAWTGTGKLNNTNLLEPSLEYNRKLVKPWN